MNPFNGNAATKSSFNVAGELGVIPHIATVQAAMRMGKNGAATNDKDNAWMVGVTYELAQNIALSLTHTTQFGSAWDADSRRCCESATGRQDSQHPVAGSLVLS